MVDLLRYSFFTRFILGFILLTSFTTYTLPLRAGWTDIIGVSPEIESTAKLMKLVDKMKKLKKNPDKSEAYKLTKKIKKEAEKLSGQKLSISKGIDDVEAMFKNEGIKVSHAQFKAVKEDIKDNGKPKEDQEEIDVPIHVTIGIVMCLCGLFLQVLPMPQCQAAGKVLIGLGGPLAGYKLCDVHEENKKKESDKNRKCVYRNMYRSFRERAKAT